MINITKLFKIRDHMSRRSKELVSIAGLLIAAIVALIAFATYASSNYSTKDATMSVKYLADQNHRAINNMKKTDRRLGSILCGMAIDLSLPTAKQECDNIISGNE